MLIYITIVCPKKPGFPLEVANGEMEKSLGPILENSLCLGCLLFVKKSKFNGTQLASYFGLRKLLK